MGEERFRQRLFVADARSTSTDSSSWSSLMDGALIARQSAQRRPAVAGAVQGRLLDRRRDAGLGPRQPAVRLVRVQRRREGRSSCSATGMQTTATELWSSNRLRLHHGNAMRIGDAIYFSSGGKGSQAILSAVDVRSGKIHWQERSIEKATFVWADQKLITLDQDGNLMIAHPSPQGFKIAAKAPLLTQPVVDAAGAGRHAAVHPRPAQPHGGGSRHNSQLPTSNSQRRVGRDSWVKGVTIRQSVTTFTPLERPSWELGVARRRSSSDPATSSGEVSAVALAAEAGSWELASLLRCRKTLSKSGVGDPSRSR